MLAVWCVHGGVESVSIARLEIIATRRSMGGREHKDKLPVLKTESNGRHNPRFSRAEQVPKRARRGTSLSIDMSGSP